MAVFQGARIRNVSMPADPAARRVKSVPTAARSRSGARPMGLIIAAILATTMLGLVYLTQTLGSNAATSEITQLAAEGNKLRGVWRTQSLYVGLELDATNVAKRARALKLKQLGDPVVLRVP
jgi:hypothetical protein